MRALRHEPTADDLVHYVCPKPEQRQQGALFMYLYKTRKCEDVFNCQVAPRHTAPRRSAARGMRALLARSARVWTFTARPSGAAGP